MRDVTWWQLAASLLFYAAIAGMVAGGTWLVVRLVSARGCRAPDWLYTVIVLVVTWGIIGLCFLGGANPPDATAFAFLMFIVPLLLGAAGVVGYGYRMERGRSSIPVWFLLAVAHAGIGGLVMWLYRTAPIHGSAMEPPPAGPVPGMLGIKWGDPYWSGFYLAVWFIGSLFLLPAGMRLVCRLRACAAVTP